MKAVHFGAGNIGRGFVGQLLHESGYEVVFADVADALIDALKAADSYTVTEIGSGTVHVVDGFRAVNSRSEEAALVQEIATADIVTTAVGPRILPFVAPVIAKGIQQRLESGADQEWGKLAVFACENAINATDLLEASVRAALTESESDALSASAVFANTAIDRIVPAQAPDAGLDVTLEPFFEWVIDRTPFGADGPPDITGVHWVDDLAPFIERKLFTVNTAHATAAYLGFQAGIHGITEAITDPAILPVVRRAIAETRSLLVAKHGLNEAEQEAYGEKIITRLSNPELPDTVERVGRGPMRKLSRGERFIAPASQLAERGMAHDALVTAVAAALRFDVPSDEESVQLQAVLATEETDGAVTVVTGIEPEHPLYADLIAVFRKRAAEL